MPTVGVYSFQSKIASRGYPVYKETSWSKVRDDKEVKVELETSQNFKQVDSFACAVRVKEGYFKGWKTVGHIPKQIFRHVYYFIKTEDGFVNETVISTKFYPSPVPADGLEIPLLFKFSCYKQATFEKMKTFVQTLYDHNFVGTFTKNNIDE